MVNEDGLTGAEGIRQALASAIGSLGVDTQPDEVDEYLVLIATVKELEIQARSILHDAVVSARSAGATWSTIGSTMGMSKQAAQKRFPGPSAPSPLNLDPGERILGHVSVFNEMEELALAGRYGWHSIDFGPTFHLVVQSDTQWEHKRVSMLRRTAKSLQDEGWQLIRSRFPYSYLKRDLSIPALVEERGHRGDGGLR